MPFEYSAENHDWDNTLMASWNLLMQGQAAGEIGNFLQIEKSTLSR